MSNETKAAMKLDPITAEIIIARLQEAGLDHGASAVP